MVQILRPDEVREKYGPMFCRGFYTLVDEEHGRAQIIEKCVATSRTSAWSPTCSSWTRSSARGS